MKESNTILIPKNKKPKVNELRPISLTNVGCKVIMAVLRMKVEEQIEKNGWGKEIQVGFTAGARIENNILILRSCIGKTF